MSAKTEFVITTTDQSKLTPKVVGDNLLFERKQCLQLGRELHKTYVANDPFPHIVIDNFLPVDCLRRIVEEFPDRNTPQFSDSQSKLKTSYSMEEIESAYITNFLSALNSSQFLGFLEEMTGIKGLIPDPHIGVGQAPRPRQRDADDAPVDQVCGDAVIRDFDVPDPRVSAHRNAHTTPP